MICVTFLELAGIIRCGIHTLLEVLDADYVVQGDHVAAARRRLLLGQ